MTKRPAYYETVSRRPESGFTLVEALLVVLIMGIVASIGLPALNSGLVESRLSGAGTEIVTALEFARMTAMATGVSTRVTIDDGAESILVERFETGIDLLGAETELAEAGVEGGSFTTMKHPMRRGENYAVLFAGDDRFKGVNIVSSTFGVNDYVTFDAMGSPSSAGTVTLSFGGGQLAVAVDALTGKVSTSG